MTDDHDAAALLAQPNLDLLDGYTSIEQAHNGLKKVVAAINLRHRDKTQHIRNAIEIFEDKKPLSDDLYDQVARELDHIYENDLCSDDELINKVIDLWRNKAKQIISQSQTPPETVPKSLQKLPRPITQTYEKIVALQKTIGEGDRHDSKELSRLLSEVATQFKDSICVDEASYDTCLKALESFIDEPIEDNTHIHKDAEMLLESMKEHKNCLLGTTQPSLQEDKTGPSQTVTAVPGTSVVIMSHVPKEKAKEITRMAQTAEEEHKGKDR